MRWRRQVDWLDAYRAGDIESILAMCTDNAVTTCGCDDMAGSFPRVEISAPGPDSGRRLPQVVGTGQFSPVFSGSHWITVRNSTEARRFLPMV